MKRRLILLALPIVLGLITLAVVIIAASIYGHGSEEDAEVVATPVPWYEWVIATTAPTPTPRPFTACIESATPANPASVYATLDGIEPRVQYWGYPPLTFDGAVVDVGCPDDMLAREGFTSRGLRPDRYHLFISVVPPERIPGRVGKKQYGFRKECFMMGDDCAEEITGIYVPSLDQDVLSEPLVQALHLSLFYWTPTPESSVSGSTS